MVEPAGRGVAWWKIFADGPRHGATGLGVIVFSLEGMLEGLIDV